MKIVFFNRFFFPDTSATSQIVSDLAFHLSESGREIHAVTSRVTEGEPRSEKVRGVSIHRVANSAAGTPSLIRRAIAYLDYYRGARRAARELISPGDVVVLKTDPPLLSAAIGHLAKRRGARVVVWLQDVFPEVAQIYGLPGIGGVGGALLRGIRNRSLAIADRIVVIGDGMGQMICRSADIPSDRVFVIHNWADGDAITPIDRDRNPLRRRWSLDRKFVVGYSGNLGRVHEFDTLLDAATRLKDISDIQFLVIGRGPRLNEVRERAGRGGLANMRFEPHQDRSTLVESLCAADVHLSILRPEFEGLVHPSKVYGIMAAGRPTIFIGDVQGETASILAATGAGLSVRTGDSAGLVAAIQALRAEEKTRTEMGQAARRAFDERYSMPIAFAKWRTVLDSFHH